MNVTKKNYYKFLAPHTQKVNLYNIGVYIFSKLGSLLDLLKSVTGDNEKLDLQTQTCVLCVHIHDDIYIY